MNWHPSSPLGWLKLAGGLAIVPVCAALLYLIEERVRGRLLLAKTEKELRGKGRKLDANAFKLPAITDDNGAPTVIRTSKELKPGVSIPDHPPPRMAILDSGRAVVGFREDEWAWNQKTHTWDGIERDLQENAPFLAGIAAALQKPVLRNDLDFSLGASLPFDHLASIKSAATWYAAAAQLDLRQGRTTSALDSLLAGARLPLVLAEDRLAISELVRIALAAIARTATWEALQVNEWTDEQLARLQREWERHSYLDGMRKALEGELVFIHESNKTFRKSHTETVKSLFSMEEFEKMLDADAGLEPAPESLTISEKLGRFAREQVYVRAWRFAWLDQWEMRSLRQLEQLLEAIHRAQQEKRSHPVFLEHHRFHAAQAARKSFDKLRYPYPGPEFALAAAAKHALHAETEVALTICAIALKRFQLRHGNSPSSLQALTPEFLESVPTDPMDGQPLKYRRSGASFVLWSAGNNQRDDGGDASLQRQTSFTSTLWSRRDVVWPEPATDQELEAFRKRRRDKESIRRMAP